MLPTAASSLLPSLPRTSVTLPLSLFLPSSVLFPPSFFKKFFFFCLYCFLLFGGLHHWARGILAPQPGIKPTSPALEAWRLNHWTTSLLSSFLSFIL